MNPLYNQMPNPQGNNMIQNFMQFRQSFQGDARQTVQNLLNSGKISQQQYNQAVMKAQQLQALLK